MKHKIIAGIGAAAAAAVFATALVAGAQTTATAMANTPQPMVLQVSQTGSVLMRGTVASVGTGSLTVNGWGGVWTVNVPSSAQILPASMGTDVSQFQAGDFVGVQGTVDQTGSWTIDATLVRDWTDHGTPTAAQKQNIQAAHETQQSAPRDYIGTAGAVNGTSFTLAGNDGTSYTVNVPAGIEIVNRNWVTLPLANIMSGDNVRVYGVNASGTITAQIVRDTTIPENSTSAPATSAQ
ncbi:MAG TPA: hypothetical protein VMT81_02805 [Candidatus Paceibacterota bacterium]|nr:hypothetical protein [Candidatus Paceibacterota bacterium]